MVAVQSYPQPPDRDFPNMSLDHFRVVPLILETGHSRPPLFIHPMCQSGASAARHYFVESLPMSLSTLITSQLSEPLRALALTVEEADPGEFRWRILERCGAASSYESLCCAESTVAAYDTALATGYGELQRLIGPDLQYGPRIEEAPLRAHVKLVASAPSPANGSASVLAKRVTSGVAARPDEVRV